MLPDYAAAEGRSGSAELYRAPFVMAILAAVSAKSNCDMLETCQ
jgi:hypothetical protein